jgi:catechol 2,3-dioxygenase-like lactoylglutathione lyase family enzyme
MIIRGANLLDVNYIHTAGRCNCRSAITRGQIEIKLLGTVKTRNYGERDADLPAASSEPQSAVDADAQNANALAQTQNAGTVGRDIGGPEAYSFNDAGAEQYKRDYRGMLDRAANTGHSLVDRPHVGEGSIDTEAGQVFSTDKHRVLHGDKPAHYERFCGREVDVRLHAPLDGHRRIRGELVESDAQRAVVRDPDGALFEIPFAAISRAHLVEEL